MSGRMRMCRLAYNSWLFSSHTRLTAVRSGRAFAWHLLMWEY